MHHDHHTDTDAIKDQFWKALSASSFVMLQLDADPDSAAPMTAQLDRDANSAIWFWTTADNRFAPGGAATATFAAKDHKLFARFAGTLTRDADPARRDQMWDNTVAAWFPQGKDSPDVLLLRMDLGDASIWDADMGFGNVAKMLLGMDVTDTTKGKFAETQL